MSPEQCQGKALDGRSDLYSLACVMYETLSGEPPFQGQTSLELMQKHSAEPPQTVSELSRKIDIRRELASATLWALAKDPAARPQTASEFAKKLNEVLERITLDKVPRLKESMQGTKSEYAIFTASSAEGLGFSSLKTVSRRLQGRVSRRRMHLSAQCRDNL